VTPQLGNVMVLLALRMAAMTLLLAGIAPRLYPDAFRALRQLPGQARLCRYSVGSGLCVFLGLAFLYLALSQVAAGIAIATFFIYPAITLLLAWVVSGQQPRPYHLPIMVMILAGVVLTTITPLSGQDANPVLGSLSAVAAGLSFGLYGVLAEICLQARKFPSTLHPVSFSLLTFGMVACLAGLTILIHPQTVDIPLTVWLPILGMSLLSASLTLVAYVLSNFGIRYIGASLTALISASTPGFTTLFAWWALQESLQSQQLVGIGVITIGVAVLSLKR
jgi:drug/metabolite transporter (DMT)-like permease